MILVNGSPFRTTYDYEDADGGTITVEGATPDYKAMGIFTYDGIEQITDKNESVEVYFNLPETDDVATFRNTSLGSELVGKTFADTNFQNPTGLIQVSGEGGADQIAIGKGGEPDFVLPGTDFKVISPGDELKLNVDFQTNGGDFVVDVDYFKSIAEKTFDLDTGFAKINVTDTAFMTGSDGSRVFRAGKFEMTGGQIDFRNADLEATTGGVSIISPGGSLLVGDIRVLTNGASVFLNGDPIGILAGSITTNDGDVTTTGGTYTFRGNARIDAGSGLVDMTHTAIMNMGGNPNRTHVAGKFTATTSIGMLDLGDADVTAENGIILDSSDSVMAGLLTNTNSGKIDVNAGTDIILPEGAVNDGGPIELTATGTIMAGDLVSTALAAKIEVKTDGDSNLDNVSTNDGEFIAVGNVNPKMTSLTILDASIINTGSGDWTIQVVEDLLIEALSVPRSHTGGNISVMANNINAADSSFQASGDVVFMAGGKVNTVDIITSGTTGKIQVDAVGSVLLGNLKAVDGNITAKTLGVVEVGTVATEAGKVAIESGDQSITASDITTSGGTVDLLAELDIVTGKIDTSANTGGHVSIESFKASITTQDILTDDGNVDLKAALDISVHEVITSSGNLVVTAGGAFTYSMIDTSGSGGDVTVDANSVTGGDIITNGGSVVLHAAGNVQTGKILAGSMSPGTGVVDISAADVMTLEITADGKVSILAGGEASTGPITGGGIVIEAVGDIVTGALKSTGAAGIELTSQDSITVNGNSSTEGGDYVANAGIGLDDDLTVYAVSTNGGNIHLQAGGTVMHGILLSGGGSIYVKGNNVIYSGSSIDTDGGNLDYITGGDLFLTNIETNGGYANLDVGGNLTFQLIDTDGGTFSSKVGGSTTGGEIDTSGADLGHVVMESGTTIDIGNVTTQVGNVVITAGPDLADYLNVGDITTKGGSVTTTAGGTTTTGNVNTMGSAAPVYVTSGDDVTMGDVITGGESFTVVTPGSLTVGAIDTTDGGQASAAGKIDFDGVEQSLTLLGELESGTDFQWGDTPYQRKLGLDAVGQNLTAFGSILIFTFGDVFTGDIQTMDSLTGATSVTIDLLDGVNIVTGNITTGSSAGFDTMIDLWTGVGVISTGNLATGDGANSNVRVLAQGGSASVGDITTGTATGNSRVVIKTSDLNLPGADTKLEAGNITTGNAGGISRVQIESDSSVTTGNVEVGTGITNRRINVDAATSIVMGNLTTPVGVIELNAGDDLTVGDVATKGASFTTTAGGTTTTGNVNTKGSSAPVYVTSGDDVTMGDVITGGESFTIVTPGSLTVGAIDTTDGGGAAATGSVDLEGVGGSVTLLGSFKSGSSFVYGSSGAYKESLIATGQDLTVFGIVSIYVTGDVSTGNLTTEDNLSGATTVTIYSRNDSGSITTGKITTGNTSSWDSRIKIWTDEGDVTTGDLKTGSGNNTDIDIDSYGGGISSGDITTGAATGDSKVYLSTFDLNNTGADITLSTGNITTGDAGDESRVRLFSGFAMTTGNIQTGIGSTTSAWLTANFADMVTGNILTGVASVNGGISLDVDEGYQISSGLLQGESYNLIASAYQINGDLSGNGSSSIRFYVDTANPPASTLMTVAGTWVVAAGTEINLFTGSGGTVSLGGDYVIATADLIDITDPLNDFDVSQVGDPAGAVDAVFAQDGADMDGDIDELVLSLIDLP